MVQLPTTNMERKSGRESFLSWMNIGDVGIGAGTNVSLVSVVGVGSGLGVSST